MNKKPKKTNSDEASLETFVERICQDVYQGRLLAAAQTILSLPSKGKVAYVTAVVCSRTIKTSHYEQFLEVLASYFDG